MIDATTRPCGRAAQRFGVGERQDSPDPGPSLPDRLTAARERKGVDLVRAERDTKIRVRYLSALEPGDYRDLPGAVYTKGFLRNYAIYLGLDPEDVLRQWRRERGEATAPEPYRPAAAHRGAGPAAQLLAPRSSWRRCSPPASSCSSSTSASSCCATRARPSCRHQPAQAVIDVEETTSSYRLAGTSTAGATITTDPRAGAAHARPPARRATGASRSTCGAARTASRSAPANPETGKAAETPREVVITVPFLESPGADIDDPSNPVEGTTYGNGAIAVEGTTTNARTVTVSSRFLGAAGGPAPAPTAAPERLRPRGDGRACREARDDGRGGRGWDLRVPAARPDRRSLGDHRHGDFGREQDRLPHAQHHRRLRRGESRRDHRGGPAWIKVWVDGKLVGAQAGSVYQAGKSLTFSGKTSVEVRTGSSGSTRFTLNGVSLGSWESPACRRRGSSPRPRVRSRPSGHRAAGVGVPGALVGLAVELQRACLERGLTVALAESCTGGLIAAALTEVPGSSGYFLGGVVSYSNEAKESMLDVPPVALEAHGAVSAQVAMAMAAAAQTRSHRPSPRRSRGSPVPTAARTRSRSGSPTSASPGEGTRRCAGCSSMATGRRFGRRRRTRRWCGSSSGRRRDAVQPPSSAPASRRPEPRDPSAPVSASTFWGSPAPAPPRRRSTRRRRVRWSPAAIRADRRRTRPRSRRRGSRSSGTTTRPTSA